MSEQGMKWLIIIAAAVALIICMALVIAGQRNIAASGLMMQMTGLAGILVLLFLYNRKYQ